MTVGRQILPNTDKLRKQTGHRATPDADARLTDEKSTIHDERVARVRDARRHREAARRSMALAIGSGDIGTYRILMAFATEHEACAAELETGRRRRT